MEFRFSISCVYRTTCDMNRSRHDIRPCSADTPIFLRTNRIQRTSGKVYLKHMFSSLLLYIVCAHYLIIHFFSIIPSLSFSLPVTVEYSHIYTYFSVNLCTWQSMCEVLILHSVQPLCTWKSLVTRYVG